MFWLSRRLTTMIQSTVLLAFVSTTVLAPAVSLAATTPTKSARPSYVNLDLKHFGNADGYTLKTVRSFRNYSFTKPHSWAISPQSHVHLSFQHSKALLPERSSLNVSVNGRMLKTIRLQDSNTTQSTLDIPVPTGILKDYNTLSFDVNQHYTYKCEDPFDASLWTTILPDTKLVLDYKLKPSKPTLSSFPYPFLDNLAYGKTQLHYALGNSASSESQQAAAVLATRMGQLAQWRSLDAVLHTTETLSTDNNLLLVGTPSELGSLTPSGKLPVALSGSQLTNPKTGQPLNDDTGVIQAFANPNNSNKAIVWVTGNTPAGVLKAAKFLAQHPHRKVLAGQYALINQLPKNPSTYREWTGFIQEPGDTSLAQLGFETLTSRGFTALPIIYKVKRMPDVLVAGGDNIKLKTVYSYSSQLDNGQSKMEVLLNGKSVGSVPLSNPKGETQATLTLDIPGGELFTYNDLEYQFYLYPEKVDLCRFVTDAHIWGTIHNNSTLNLPGQLKAAVPDVGLLNDAGFPFSGHPDFRDVTVVLPTNPTANEQQLLLSMANRFGHGSHSNGGIDLQVTTEDALTDKQKQGHVIAIGSPTRLPSLYGEFEAKSERLLSNGTLVKEEGEESATTDFPSITYDASQGVIEELISPWNKEKSILLLTGQEDESSKVLSKLFDTDKLYAAIQPGNLAVVNADGTTQSTILLKEGEARFIEPGQSKLVKTEWPLWAWVGIGILSVIGLFTILKGMIFKS